MSSVYTRLGQRINSVPMWVKIMGIVVLPLSLVLLIAVLGIRWQVRMYLLEHSASEELRSLLTVLSRDLLATTLITAAFGLLLLDEPTAHLDIGNKTRLARLVKELSAQGMTVVLTTHEPEFAAACATHLVLMRIGQVLETGPLDEVLTTTNLSRLYGKTVEVLEHNHRKVVAWH